VSYIYILLSPFDSLTWTLTILTFFFVPLVVAWEVKAEDKLFFSFQVAFKQAFVLGKKGTTRAALIMVVFVAVILTAAYEGRLFL
jgi:hypothetical protein